MLTYLIQCQHVEVGNVMFLRVTDSGPTFLLIDQFSHVFVHELALKARGGEKSETKNTD